MTTTPAPAKDHGRAGRNLPAAIGSAVVLLAAIAASLAFWKTAFLLHRRRGRRRGDLGAAAGAARQGTSTCPSSR